MTRRQRRLALIGSERWRCLASRSALVLTVALRDSIVFFHHADRESRKRRSSPERDSASAGWCSRAAWCTATTAVTFDVADGRRDCRALRGRPARSVP